MNNLFLITQIDLSNSKHIRHFTIPRASMGYRQLNSFNWFFWGVKKRNYSKKYLYKADRLWEFQDFANKGIWFAMVVMDELKEMPPIECVDLYDFYIKIGYDRKTKKHEVHV